jgi:hypothetical protein
MDDLARRLRDAGIAYSDLRDALVAGEPWPLSDDYGHTPESEWGPPEILGHVDEMLAYWVDELERVLAGDPAGPVAFGRIATDQSRMDRIDADRRKPMGALLDDIAAGLDRAAGFAAGLDADAVARIGVHPSRGEITIAESLERFLAAHLEDHLAQLREHLAQPRGT